MLKKAGIIIMIAVSFFVLISCNIKKEKEARIIIKNMSLEEKIGQMLILGMPDKKMTANAVSIIEEYLPGGVILFGFNIGNYTELTNYINMMQQTAIAKYRMPLFISIDQEGGRVRRIMDGVTQFPGNMAFGTADNESLIYDAARITGIELRTIGINMNMAPVLDVNSNPANPVINTRSFGSDADTVSRMGGTYIRGLQKSGCIAVAKHFPGHGETDKDSHLTLPVINYNLERLRKLEFVPFVKAIDSGVEAIMTAHISYPNVLNNEIPATISREFLTGILREEMRFEGLIITDDLEMNAVSKIMDLGEAAVRSIEAGSDIVLISTHAKSIDIISRSIKEAVVGGRISEKRIDDSVKKIVEVKLKYIGNFNNGEIKYSEYKHTEKDTAILEKREELNRRVSREAILYYTYEDNNTFNIIEPGCIFISNNELFRKKIKDAYNNLKTDKYKIFNTGSEFVKYTISKNDIDMKDSVVYYHFDAAPSILKEIINICNKKGIKLYLVCTGNPFLLRNIEKLPPVFISFSNTDESIRQITACLAGEFKPKQNININLGFNMDKE